MRADVAVPALVGGRVQLAEMQAMRAVRELSTG
jgi:hypothetical protein